MSYFNRQCVIGVSLSEPHTYVKYIKSVGVYIYIIRQHNSASYVGMVVVVYIP